MKKLIADEGYVFARKDKTAVYDNLLYLSDIDSEDNYVQMVKEDAEKLKKELEERVYADHS